MIYNLKIILQFAVTIIIIFCLVQSKVGPVNNF